MKHLIPAFKSKFKDKDLQATCQVDYANKRKRLFPQRYNYGAVGFDDDTPFGCYNEECYGGDFAYGGWDS